MVQDDDAIATVLQVPRVDHASGPWYLVQVRNATISIALLSALLGGCTFYTACPPADQGGGTAGSGSGSAGSAGTDANLPAWVNVTSNLAGLASECGNLSVLTSSGDQVFAGVNPGRLFTTTDAGESWFEVAQGKGTEPIDASITTLVFDPDHPKTFWIAGIYGTFGIWRTDDFGDTFRALGTLHHNESVSVDFSDPKRRTLLAGGHEQSQVVYRSKDAGETWEGIGEKFPSNTPVSSFPQVINSDEVLMGAVGYNPGKPGIYRSDDTGDTWTRVSAAGGFGKALLTSTGILYWPGDDGSVVKSDDDGKTWDEVAPAGTVTGTFSVHELPDGRLAVLTPTGGIKVTNDDFVTLTQVVQRTPYTTGGFTYSVSAKAFFISHSDCGVKVLDDAIMRADFDYEAM